MLCVGFRTENRATPSSPKSSCGGQPICSAPTTARRHAESTCSPTLMHTIPMMQQIVLGASQVGEESAHPLRHIGSGPADLTIHQCGELVEQPFAGPAAPAGAESPHCLGERQFHRWLVVRTCTKNPLRNR